LFQIRFHFSRNFLRSIATQFLAANHLLCEISLHFHIDVIPLQVLLTLAVTAVMARPSFHEGHGLGTDEPKLISQSVHLHEVPTKVIKVIKTVAIKVPVPYPVKVGSLQILSERTNSTP